ncbi:MAG: hypothetical protein J07HX64_01800 [halophilic archaeon J07HX64]|nr:MAG: hypothetical protein J07HX64_01800 [halophilic archaeon J07HX64]
MCVAWSPLMTAETAVETGYCLYIEVVSA